MKWCIFIHDAQNIIKMPHTDEPLATAYQIAQNILDFKIITNRDSIGYCLDDFIEYYKQFDKMVLVYNGTFWLDGPANHAFWTLSFNRENINHKTSGLIDGYLKTEYKEGNGEKLFAEIIYNVIDRFTENNLPKGITPEYRKQLLEQLNNYI